MSRAPTQVTDLSVSRVKVADKCALAYHYQYVDRLPAPAEKARKVFGTVVHNGVERWYGEPGSEHHRQVELAAYVDECWWEHLPTKVASALRTCIARGRDTDALASAIALARPQIKAVRQTKDFLASAEFARFEDARDRLLQAAEKCEEMSWPSNENAYQAYQKSLLIAQQLQERWQALPRPLLVEGGFNIEFAGLRIRGRIDQIRQDPDPQGEVKTALLDLKTGTQPLTQMDAFIQAFLYDEACYVSPELPDIDYVTFWLARHNRPQHGRIDRKRHRRLAERILHSVKARIETGDNAPHFGMWCKSCDFAPLCEAEISLWPPGSDSLTLGLA